MTNELPGEEELDPGLILKVGAIAATRFAVVMPVAALEPRSRRVLRRSSNLTEGHRATTFALMMTSLVVVAVLTGLGLLSVALIRYNKAFAGMTLLLLGLQCFGAGFCATLSLTTYTGLLAAERVDLAPAAPATAQEPRRLDG